MNVILSPTGTLELSPGQKLSLFGTTLSVLSDFIRIYSDLPSWIEICEPVSLILSNIETENPTINVRYMFGNIQEKLSVMKNKLDTSISSAKLKRVPLQLLKRKPIPIKTYTPQFEKKYFKIDTNFIVIQLTRNIILIRKRQNLPSLSSNTNKNSRVQFVN